MNEEIIIDGVNVAGCYYMYDNGDLNYMCQNGVGTCICRENKDCYYKQLKRLKQKYNEVLKLSKEGMDAQEYCLQEDDEIIGKLQKENEQLKKRLEIANKQMADEEAKHYAMEEEIEELKVKLDECNNEFRCEETCKLKEEHNHYIDVINELKKENEELKRTSTEIIFNIRKESYQYYKTLEEIRGITENHKKCFYGCCVDCKYQQECNGDDCSKFHIDKINKVLESEEK